MPFRYDFTRLVTRRHLIETLGLTEDVFEWVTTFEPPPEPPPRKPPEEKGGAVEEVTIPPFFQHRIPKRNRARGYRIAWEPSLCKAEYKALGRWLGGFFEHKLASYPHPSVFGYLGGRNIKDNAAVHTGHERLLAVDLTDFFSSISAARIERLFIETGMSEQVASALSRFVTIGGTLPLGLPTSPVISNAVFLPTDIRLLALAQDVGAAYGRYSDDLAFSGHGDLPTLEDIKSILADGGFALAAGKTRRSCRGQAHYVTGLSVSDPQQPHVPRQKKRRLRQELYYAQKFGLADHQVRKGINDAEIAQRDTNRLDGLVKFVAHHEPRLSARIKSQWTSILQAAGARPSYTPRRQNATPFYICIDEAEYRAAPDGPVLALGMSVSQYQNRMVAAARDALEETLADPWADGDRDAIIKRGLHFTDATEDVKRAYVERLRPLPFEGYVVMAPLRGPEHYEATYLRLLGAVLKRRLMAAESQFATFIIEQNSKVSEAKVRAAIEAVRLELKADNNRRPRAIAVGFVGKPDPCISAPDFLLGLLGRYLASPDAPRGQPERRERLMFERLREKYRLILELEPWTEYTRRRPIEPWAARLSLESGLATFSSPTN